MAKEIENPFTNRYPPNVRFTHGAFKNKVHLNPKYEEFGESITDKEAYRLQLVSGSASVGASASPQYAFKDGKYDAQLDFSFLQRPDLTIVDIDKYISTLKKQAEDYDASLKTDIVNAIKELEAKKVEKTSGGDSPTTATE